MKATTYFEKAGSGRADAVMRKWPLGDEICTLAGRVWSAILKLVPENSQTAMQQFSQHRKIWPRMIGSTMLQRHGRKYFWSG